MDLITPLTNIGLSKKEAKIYIASLELGPSPISELAKKARVKRPTAYVIVEELRKKKLVHEITKGKRVFYFVEDPEKITKKIEDSLVEMNNISPVLKSLYANPPSRPKVRFFEGKEGLLEVYSEITLSGEKMHTCFSLDKFLKIFSKKEVEKLYELAKESKTESDDLLRKSRAAKKWVEMKKIFIKGKTKFLPDEIKITNDILIYGNKVALISFADLVAVIIESKEIAEMQRMFLRFIWEHSKDI